MSNIDEQQVYALKSRVNKLEAQVEYLYKHLGVTFVEDHRLTDDPQVIAALKSNNLIEAIKIYRAKNDSGLAEAKSAVEEMKARLGT